MLNILIIDDEDLIREGLKMALEQNGYSVLIASNGKEALEKVKKFNPDLVITDIIMPEKDGIEVIMTIKKQLKDAKIIAISGGGRISAVDHLKIAKQLGATSILTKPFSTVELLNEIESLFDEN